jgi:putative hydrolase of the HAD superfamily
VAAHVPAAVDLLILDINAIVDRCDTDRRVALLAAATATTPAEVKSAVFGSGVEAGSDAGRLEPDEYLAAIGEHHGNAVDRATWTASLAGDVTPIEESLDHGA